MEYQVNVGDQNTQQIGQNPVNQPTIIQEKPRVNYWMIFIVIVIIAVTVLAGVVYFFKTNQSSSSITPEKNSLKEKTIVAIQPSNKGTTFYTFNPVSKDKNVFLRLGRNIVVNEAGVSSDGKKIYYIPSESLQMPGKVTIVDIEKSNKEIDFAKSNLWTLSNPGILVGGLENDCFWSPDSNKLACLLIERESVNGAGTGRAKVSVFDFSSGNVSDVLTSDQITPPQRARVFTKLAGWIGNNKLLVVQTKNSLGQDIEPADFYFVDISAKNLVKEFSYRYDSGFKIAITPNGKQIFFESFSRINEDIFIKYDLDTKQETVLASTKDVLGTTHPVISEDGSKTVYTTYVFLKSVEEMSRLRPEELKGSGQSEIHIYDLLTNKEKTVRLNEAIGFVETLFADGKTFILNKTPDGSVVYDSESQVVDKMEGQFIGFGFF
ncbi:hypothetical protein COU86_05925 [Candidatus Roizmanbacteria bacterium CG10_big_fil_rev_8_21_14_0_10_36_26]|uniref:Dipeptidylpeptidase IV N-terminal domain-containing protein n=1 Tax=Candidatus Roizmanbacteria bacterium CG10_big_fil_rev_8_21_14_0_10_36_26 TaxID=1974851 RepID=A0A2M8KJQ5_9BACT|nr:MAG: hypothetical protein COU86_05925 [Candidatus Roizmanbacteria bacterium CG10_big_fil_rev_8_21_14_0_10_36_26]